MKGIVREDVIQEKIGFKPHNGQRPVIEAYRKSKREIVLCAGRRFGKSNVCGYLALLEALKPERRIWIVSPTTDLSQRVFTYVIKYVSGIFSSGVKMTTKPFNKITLANGSYIECRTAENPVSLLGEELDLLIVDEAAMVKPNIYERYLFPTTSSRKGISVFISTPNGRNWFYNKFTQCKESDSAFNFPSSINPFLSKEEIERARELLPEDTFKQEYLAQFLDNAAQVFRKVMGCVREDCLSEPKKDHRYIIGADLAKYKDYNVYTVVDRQTHKVVYFDRTQGVDWVLQKERLIALAKRYNNARIIVDATGLGSPIVDDLRHAGLSVDPFIFTNTSKKQLIEKLIVFTEQQSILIPNIEVLLDELETFGCYVTDSGNLIYEAPAGMHDDCVCSLALAAWGLYSIKNSSPVDDFIPLEERRPKRHTFEYR